VHRAVTSRPNFSRSGETVESKRLLAGDRPAVEISIIAVEAADAVPWTKSHDLFYDKDKPLPKLGGQFQEGFNVLMADGAALFISQQVTDDTIRAATTRRGGELLSSDKLLP
jgi:hypothetical protein